MSIFKNALTAIRFEGGSYETNIAGQVVTFPPIELKTALISVAQAKKIIRTEIQGRDGTVKEYIGMDDYSVNVSGVLTGTATIRPVDDVLNLKKMLDAPIAIDVVCKHLQDLGIHQLIVESYELPQDAGGEMYQSFNINFISEQPTELRISNV
jgi:hypothetical protein